MYIFVRRVYEMYAALLLATASFVIPLMALVVKIVRLSAGCEGGGKH